MNLSKNLRKSCMPGVQLVGSSVKRAPSQHDAGEEHKSQGAFSDFNCLNLAGFFYFVGWKEPTSRT